MRVNPVTVFVFQTEDTPPIYMTKQSKQTRGLYFSCSIVIYKKENKISNLVCNNDASIRENAYQFIAKEVYRFIGAK